jgi:Family of unknown function (DUF6912)
MRVYLPATLPALADVLRKGEIGPAPLRGFAVTPALREWYASGDDEELEYVAMNHAGRVSLRLLGADPGAPRRRIVLATELPAELITAGGGFSDPALVEVTRAVPLARVVSGHVDDQLAVADVAKAVDSIPAADAGDEDARFALDSAEGHELLWYATQELPYLTE